MEARPTLSFFLLCVLVPALWTGADAAMQEPSKRINLDARDMPLSQVIDTLFKDTGLSYTIDPDIGQLGVTAVLKNVNFETALRNIARAAGVVYRIDGDTYVFASAQPRTSPGPPPGGPPPSDGILEKIPLEFVEPPDIVPVLQMDGTVLVVGSGPSFVVVKGSKDAVEKAKQTVRMLDTPNAYPQAVRIKLVARITVEEKNKAAKTYEASSESVGAAGAPMPLRIQASSGVLPGPRAAAGAAGRHQASAVDATLIPLVDSQAKVSLTGQGVIRGELPIKYEKAFEVAAACSSGQRVVIAAGGAELEDGKVDFEVSVVPTVEKERVKRPMARPEIGLELGRELGPGRPPTPTGPPAVPQLGSRPSGMQPPRQPGTPGGPGAASGGNPMMQPRPPRQPIEPAGPPQGPPSGGPPQGPPPGGPPAGAPAGPPPAPGGLQEPPPPEPAPEPAQGAPPQPAGD